MISRTIHRGSLLSIGIVLLLGAACATDAQLASASPSISAAPAPTSIDARVDSVFAHFGPATPGCAVGVYRAGEIVFAKGYGMADLEHGVPITTETVFDIASNSKQFTAFAIQLLARQGKLSLDDDVRKHVPELPDLDAVTTLRHLLINTAELAEYASVYHSEELDVFWTVRVHEDALVLQRRGAADTRLAPLLPHAFSSPPLMITFLRGADGAVSGLSVNTSRALNVEFSRVPDR